MTDKEVEHALTTVDNPFDPFTQFEDWNAFDQQSGYYSLSLLARIAVVAEDLPQPLYDAEVERAIDEIVEHNASGMHRKVSRTVPVAEEVDS